MYKKVDSKLDLAKVEEEILDFWGKEKIFEKSLEQTKGNEPYTFYDGPPFATGTPHYGNIVASTMKDVVPRFWTMQGRYVERKWGWDCHGLPIENIAEKALNIKEKKQIEEIGVEKFNQTCRSKVLEYVTKWEKVIHRMGRWADMKNSYKTMDLSYMESVWWVFKQLWDKGLIYEGYRSMHICPRCETTLSQSEVTEGYKTIKDLSVIAKFRLVDDPKTSILAWTTTPWTLIGNVVLAVSKDINYAKVEALDPETDRMQNFILAKDRVKDVFMDREFRVIEEKKGSDLVGLKYQPLFNYYSSNKDLENVENGWNVVEADFVTTEEGTGVIHIAPAFGEDDMNLGKKLNLPFIQHVGMDGVIKKEAGPFAGMHVKPIEDVQKTDVEIIKYLADNNNLFSKEKYEHSYPHCWRCDTPLLNYATSSWFVAVTKIKSELLKQAEGINWSPKHIKAGRFGKWLEGAKDWSISRQRYWASVIPIWQCKDCNETKVIGSVVELEELSGQKITDLHKDKMDQITFKCTKCQGEMKRIPDVLDTWFDSGSMPYAQLHYPFENKEKFDQVFPAEFIAEGSDQTRAWFYYLHTISTAIFNKAAYKNVIVNGIVLASDGKKMSKRLQNYPDPMEMFHKYGADVIRFYLLSSPVMLADNLNFSEEDVAKLSRGMFRMLWNSYSFFILYANIDNWKPDNSEFQPQNALDKWILAELNQLVKDVNKSMKEYDLVKSSRLFIPFIDSVSNWYIRRSRRRFWKSESDQDKNSAYNTLYEVLVTLSKLMAPFIPFVSEEIYKNLTGEESVHLAKYPEVNEKYLDKEIIKQMNLAKKIVETGLAKRSEANIKVRQPLSSLEYGGEKLDQEIEEIIADEVNVKKVFHNEDKSEDWLELDMNITGELKQEGLAREIIRAIQSLRKDSGFDVTDRIVVYYQSEVKELLAVMENSLELIKKEVLAEQIVNQKRNSEGETEFNLSGNKIWFGLSRLQNAQET